MSVTGETFTAPRPSQGAGRCRTASAPEDSGGPQEGGLPQTRPYEGSQRAAPNRQPSSSRVTGACVPAREDQHRVCISPPRPKPRARVRRSAVIDTSDLLLGKQAYAPQTAWLSGVGELVVSCKIPSRARQPAAGGSSSGTADPLALQGFYANPARRGESRPLGHSPLPRWHTGVAEPQNRASTSHKIGWVPSSLREWRSAPTPQRANRCTHR